MERLKCMWIYQGKRSDWAFRLCDYHCDTFGL